MSSVDLLAAANRLYDAHDTMDRDQFCKAVVETMRDHYIRGGIGAIDALTESMPAELLNAPEDARKMVAALLNICDKFRLTMVGKLRL